LKKAKKVGRPQLAKKKRVKVSVSVDPDKLKAAKKINPRFSMILDELLARYLSEKTIAA
jgi:hypothetical protein